MVREGRDGMVGDQEKPGWLLVSNDAARRREMEHSALEPRYSGPCHKRTCSLSARASWPPAAAIRLPPRTRGTHQSSGTCQASLAGLRNRCIEGPRFAELLRAWADSWRDWHFDLDEVRDAAGDIVFVAIHEWGIGVDSGASVDQRRYFAVTVRGGRTGRVRMFSDRSDVLKA